MIVTMMEINKLVPYENNPRQNENSVVHFAKSIQEFGFRQPIVVDENNVIIIGHTRLKAAFKLNLTEVPVHVATGLSPEKIKALRIADNKIAEFATWDNDLLIDELQFFGDNAPDFDLTLTGFSLDELGDLLLDPVEKFQTNNTTELTKPVNEGDRYMLGDSELIVGTNLLDMEWLLKSYEKYSNSVVKREQ